MRRCLSPMITSLTGTASQQESQPRKPIEKVFIERFNGRLCDEVLKETLPQSLRHARVTLTAWRQPPLPRPPKRAKTDS